MRCIQNVQFRELSSQQSLNTPVTALVRAFRDTLRARADHPLPVPAADQATSERRQGQQALPDAGAWRSPDRPLLALARRIPRDGQ